MKEFDTFQMSAILNLRPINKIFSCMMNNYSSFLFNTSPCPGRISVVFGSAIKYTKEMYFY